MKHKQTACILQQPGAAGLRYARLTRRASHLLVLAGRDVPVFVERSAEVAKAVQDILTGKCFDNGTICASEQSVVVDAPIEKAVR